MEKGMKDSTREREGEGERERERRERGERRGGMGRING